MSSFLQTFGDIPLRELFADWQLRPMGEDDAQWLNFPPREFLDWVRSFPRYPQFDGVPPSSDSQMRAELPALPGTRRLAEEPVGGPVSIK